MTYKETKAIKNVSYFCCFYLKHWRGNEVECL